MKRIERRRLIICRKIKISGDAILNIKNVSLQGVRTIQRPERNLCTCIYIRVTMSRAVAEATEMPGESGELRTLSDVFWMCDQSRPSPYIYIHTRMTSKMTSGEPKAFS